MTCNPYNIKVTEGNSFAVILTLKTRTYSADAPIDNDIDPTALADVHVKVNGAEWSAFTVGVEGVSVQFPATQPCGTYNVELTANYNGITIRAAYFECVTIVAWSYQSDAQNYIPDSPLSAKAAYIIAGNYTDVELEALKQQYRDAIEAAEQAEADAEQAKEDYIEKADNLNNLDNVAQQGSNPNATNTAILDGINNITIDTSTLAQRTDVKDGNDTAISVAKEIRSEVGTGSDTAAETGTLFAVLKWVKDKVKSIYNALTDSTNGLAAIKSAMPTGYALQGSDSTATNSAMLAVLNSISTNMYKGVPVVTQTTSATISPNVWNVWSSAVGAITITKGTDISGIVNEYMIRFVAGASTAITFSGWPLTWYSGSVPTWTDGKTYEISIINDLALWAEF